MGPRTPQEGFGSSLIQGIAPITTNKGSMFSDAPGSVGFYGAGDNRHDPGFAYMRLKKEGIGVWFKGRVTEAFPPEDSSRFPWDIVAYPDPDSTADNPPYLAKIVPGTIGGILPSNYDEEFDVGTGLKYAVVDCTTNGEGVTSATISFESSFPSQISATADKAPTSFKVCFGMVNKEANKAPEVYNFWKRSPSAVPNAAFVIGSTTPTTPHKFYYTWRIG
jgi:hypothetical protein